MDNSIKIVSVILIRAFTMFLLRILFIFLVLLIDIFNLPVILAILISEEVCNDTDFENHHLFKDYCNYTLSSPKKLINVYKDVMKNTVPPKEFSSVCVKCATCLAIAYQLNDTIAKVREQCDGVKVENTLNEEIDNLCRYGFSNYDLRSFEGNMIITNNYKITRHIPSVMDGKWSKKLENMCYFYKDHLNVNYIYNEFTKHGSFNMADYLCRGDGVFRDCANVDCLDTQLPTEPEGILSYILKCI